MGSKHNVAQKVTGATLLIALGIIYGDIGTSPLYVFKAIIGDKEISDALVLGGVSCVFWTLVFQTTIKYVWLTLKADNDGEGGIFSLYSLVRRYGKKLVIPTMIGAATLLADGIITPAVSVTSAIEGLEMVPGLEHLKVIPIVFAIISAIFLFQRFGTKKVGFAFGPIMAIWFSVLFLLGLIWILKYPAVLRALSPHYAYDLLTHYPQGFWLLGAVFLCTTGAEALYSDMGHCGKRNIRVTWVFVKICLVVNYLGQAAWLLHQKEAFLNMRNPFFEIMPQWFLFSGIIIATLAAIVASQALISGSFTLINEAINLGFWQKSSVRQPTDSKGQIYIPSINFVLWLGCIIVIFYFQSSARMEAAYGLAITITMLMTTYLLYFFLRYKLKWDLAVVSLLIGLFVVIEVSFFVANIMKFTEGGYITVLVGGLFFLFMYITYYGKKINSRFTTFVALGQHEKLITELSEDQSIPKFTTHLIYMTKSVRRDYVEERIIKSIFSQKPKRADVYWLFHIHPSDNPYTLDYEVVELVDDKIIRVVLNVGFRIRPKTELYFKQIMKELVESKEVDMHQIYNGATKYNPLPDFKFILFNQYLSVENEFNFKQGLILKAYYFLKGLAQKDEVAFGLDRSDVLVESSPFVYNQVEPIRLVRKDLH